LLPLEDLLFKPLANLVNKEVDEELDVDVVVVEEEDVTEEVSDLPLLLKVWIKR